MRLREMKPNIPGECGPSAWFALVLITAIGIHVGLSTASGAFERARPFPDTRDGIHVFYDQPPFNLTPAQQEFVATHFVGCQKIPVDLADAIRNYNEDFIVLNYRLSFGTYDTIPGYLSGDQWINDWDIVDPHTDWFVTDPGSPNPGGRIRQMDWGWFLMDISGEVNGNTANGWKEYWAETVLDQLRSTHCDGIFADSYGLPWNLDYTPDWLVPPNDVAWIDHMEQFGFYVSEELGGQLESFDFIPNVGPWITTRDTCDYGAFVDGVMVEMFASPGPWDLYEIEDWELEMNRILDLEHRGRIVICQPITEDEWAVSERMYNLANYLLIKGENTYYNLVFGENFYDRLMFLPEYLVELGPYTDEIPVNIRELYDQSLGLYTREYANGRVFVNPTWAEVTFDLEEEFYTIDTDDLFNDPLVDIEEDGVFRDSLAFTQVSGSITVEAKGGLLLLESLHAHVTPIPVENSCELRLLGSAPTPFNESTRIAFELSAPRGGILRLVIYDAGGRVMRNLERSCFRAGRDWVIWDGCDDTGQHAGSGSYFCVLQQHDGVSSNGLPLVLLR